MIKYGYKKIICIVNPFDILFKKNQKSKLFCGHWPIFRFDFVLCFWITFLVEDLSMASYKISSRCLQISSRGCQVLIFYLLVFD